MYISFTSKYQSASILSLLAFYTQTNTFIFLVKVIDLILGAWGMATLWEAVIADVGVALLAILNAVNKSPLLFYTNRLHGILTSNLFNPNISLLLF